MAFRAVLDTSVILAAHRSTSPTSPNRELIDRWILREFTTLYSLDVALEYARKLREHGIAPEVIEELLTSLALRGDYVVITHFHVRFYPQDADDIPFLLCALNGNASHLVSYDPHLLSIDDHHEVRICQPLDFLRELRP